MINVKPSSIKKIYLGQKDFHFSPDGIKLVPRACVEILPECPWQIRDQINYALSKGWLQPVAYMRDEEYTWELLQK